jgi:hypothetical protein
MKPISVKQPRFAGLLAALALAFCYGELRAGANSADTVVRRNAEALIGMYKRWRSMVRCRRAEEAL